MRGGRAISLSLAQSFGHPTQETGATAAKAFACALDFPEAAFRAEAFTDPRRGTITQTDAYPENLADSKIFSYAEADAGPET